jgi:hypothetical protein
VGSALITRPGNAPLPVSGLPQQPNVVLADLEALGKSLDRRSTASAG